MTTSSSTQSDTGQLSPEFFNESKQATIYGVCSACICVNTIAVALRFIARRIGRIGWKLDDFFILLAYVFCMALAVSSIGMYIQASKT
jgi:hypothetical protein